jgi:murein DD-endopeptidase MepM/ murein hydrolase activator NlpD
MSQEPAPYINKGEIVFSKSGQKSKHDLHPKSESYKKPTHTAFDHSIEVSSTEIAEISQTTLEPLENTGHKPTKDEERPIQQEDTHKEPIYKEEDGPIQGRDMNKLTDLDLENEIDKKALTSKTAKIEDNTKEAITMASGKSYKTRSPLGSDKFDWPVEGKLLSHYGKLGNKFNEGINIAAPLGSPVSAASDGKVVYIGNNVEGYGNLLIIKHDGDIMTAYAHLKDIVVERGATVKRGESIGSVGQVGNVNQPQLHFSVRKGKKTIDPELPLG